MKLKILSKFLLIVILKINKAEPWNYTSVELHFSAPSEVFAIPILNACQSQAWAILLHAPQRWIVLKGVGLYVLFKVWYERCSLPKKPWKVAINAYGLQSCLDKMLKNKSRRRKRWKKYVSSNIAKPCNKWKNKAVCIQAEQFAEFIGHGELSKQQVRDFWHVWGGMHSLTPAVCLFWGTRRWLKSTLWVESTLIFALRCQLGPSLGLFKA